MQRIKYTTIPIDTWKNNNTIVLFKWKHPERYTPHPINEAKPKVGRISFKLLHYWIR